MCVCVWLGDQYGVAVTTTFLCDQTIPVDGECLGVITPQPSVPFLHFCFFDWQSGNGRGLQLQS